MLTLFFVDPEYLNFYFLYFFVLFFFFFFSFCNCRLAVKKIHAVHG